MTRISDDNSSGNWSSRPAHTQQCQHIPPDLHTHINASTSFQTYAHTAIPAHPSRPTHTHQCQHILPDLHTQQYQHIPPDLRTHNNASKSFQTYTHTHACTHAHMHAHTHIEQVIQAACIIQLYLTKAESTWWLTCKTSFKWLHYHQSVTSLQRRWPTSEKYITGQPFHW